MRQRKGIQAAKYGTLGRGPGRSLPEASLPQAHAVYNALTRSRLPRCSHNSSSPAVYALGYLAVELLIGSEMPLENTFWIGCDVPTEMLHSLDVQHTCFDLKTDPEHRL